MVHRDARRAFERDFGRDDFGRDLDVLVALVVDAGTAPTRGDGSSVVPPNCSDRIAAVNA